MKTREGRLVAKDGLTIFWKAYLPEDKPRAVLHIIHGFAEHIERYRFVIDALVPSGIAVIGNDHRGHGRSAGPRGHVNSFQDYIDDERQFALEVVRPMFAGIPCFLLGHSMGSVIAMNYVEQFPDGLKALILSGTGSGSGAGVNVFIKTVLKILSRLLPSISIKSPLPPDFISRDPEVVKAYMQDPYVYDHLTPRLGEQMQTYLSLGAHNICKVKLPLLIQYGSLDSAFSGQQKLYEDAGCKDKTIRIYNGLKHEVYNELPEDRVWVLKDLHDWIEAHI